MSTPTAVAEEVGNLTSTAGMLLLSNPATAVAGGTLMVGGQIMAWLFSLSGASERPSVPSISDITSAVQQVLDDDDVKKIYLEAQSVFGDLLQHYSGGWAVGSETPTAAELKEFTDIISRGISLSQVGGVHDGVNQFPAYLDVVDGQGHPIGLRHLDYYSFAANVELCCMQDNMLILGAATKFGTGPNSAVNGQYAQAIKDYSLRLKTVSDVLSSRVATATAALSQRLSAISGVTSSTITVPGVNGGGISSSSWGAADHGKWPSPPGAELVVNVSYSDGFFGAGSTEAKEKAVAEKQLAAHRQSVTASSNVALGLVNASGLTGMISKWGEIRSNLSPMGG